MIPQINIDSENSPSSPESGFHEVPEEGLQNDAIIFQNFEKEVGNPRKRPIQELREEVIKINNTLTVEIALYEKVQETVDKIQAELAALEVNDRSLAKKLENLGNEKDDLDVKTLLLISLLSRPKPEK